MATEGSSHGLPPRTANRFPMVREQRGDAELFDASPGDRLKRTVEALYFAFAGLSLDEALAYCPHCFTNSDVSYVRETRLRKLAFEEIAFILVKCPSTLGSARDLSYFLPRIFEAWANRALYMPEVIPDRIEVARGSGWTDAQLSAVVEFVGALFDAINALERNASWYYELEPEAERLRRALPEAAPLIRLTLREAPG